MRKVARRAKTRKRRQVERAARRERQGRTQMAVDAVIAGVVRTAIEAALVEEVTALLGRGPRERRRRDDATEVAARCNRCGTQRRSQFYRAGTYLRSLLTFEVWTPVRVPRVSCVCGGMVDVEFVHLVPYGRRWFDVEERARELAALCVSLRDAVQVLAWRNGQPLALTTVHGIVNETARLHAAWAAGPLERVPAVVLLGCCSMGSGSRRWSRRGRLIWIAPGGSGRASGNGPGRSRTWPILVAYGVDPVSGERWLLDWERGEAEDAASWQRFLERLEQRGLVAERGLELISHDGGSGLAAALTTVYFGPGVEFQRCIFHKLRHTWQAVRGDEAMSRKDRQQRRQAVLADARAIYQHDTVAACQQALGDFRTKWAGAEPEAVATLERDFAQTLTSLRVRDRARARGLI